MSEEVCDICCRSSYHQHVPRQGELLHKVPVMNPKFGGGTLSGSCGLIESCQPPAVGQQNIRCPFQQESLPCLGLVL